MKRRLIYCALSLAVTVASTHSNASSHTDSLKQGAILSGGAIIGAVVGGPFGLVAGATLGALASKDVSKDTNVSKDTKDTGEAETKPFDMATTIQPEGAAAGQPIDLLVLNQGMANADISADTSAEKTIGLINAADIPGTKLLAAGAGEPELYSALISQDERASVHSVDDPSSDLSPALGREIYFESSSDQLTDEGRAIIESLAQTIKQQRQIRVELVGHTDPRGTDEFNNVLSQYRALTVQDQLIELGVSPHQLSTRGEGSNYSTAAKGDREGYAFERRVDIIVSTDDAIALQE